MRKRLLDPSTYLYCELQMWTSARNKMLVATGRRAPTQRAPTRVLAQKGPYQIQTPISSVSV